MDGPSEAAYVLVVDDEADICNLVSLALADEGYAVACARNGAEALAVVRARAPDLILLDLRMSVMDGWTFASEYRALPDADAAIVVFTAAGDGEASAAVLGAAGHLTKPFELDDLTRTVRRALHTRGVDA